MALIVQKYGGTSVANAERIRNVANRVAKTADKGNQVVVVVSAKSKVTDGLIREAHELVESPDKRELDAMASTGENITSALLAMTLKSMNYPAVSLSGFQAGIETDSSYGNARIVKINETRMLDMLKKGNIVVVAGFQGIDPEGNITTLGRGGSDTSAVAVAAAIKADVCEIYTDVEGVFSADPNVCKNARKWDRISAEEMLEMASLGAKVMHNRSIEFALNYNVPLYVRSSFNEEEGTMIAKNGDQDMESRVVSGIAHSKNDARITLKAVPDQPGIAARIFSPIAAAGINVDMIIQNTRAGGDTDITFTVPKTEYKNALEISKNTAKEISAQDVLGDERIAKISAIGVGMKSHPGVAAKVFDTLARENINIMMISTSEIRISCIIEERYAELAVRALHTAFGLDKE